MIEFVLNHADELTKLTHIQDYHKLRVEYKKEKTGITQKKRRENGDINTHLVEYEQKIREYESISRGNQTVRELMNIFDTYVSDMFLTQRYKPIDFIIVKGLTKDTYAAKTLPPHVAVANKMKARNIIVQQNDRIEYVLIDRGCKPGSPETQDVKAEDYAFQQEYSDWIKVDYLYYLEKQIINPVEQIFEVACGVHNFAEESYTYRYNKKMLNYAFKQLCSPILHFEEATNGRLLE
jgi:DNA polymerase elongation subunit (family B)